MADTPSPPITKNKERPYKLIGALVLIGLLIAVFFGLADLSGPGLFTQDGAFLALAVGVIIVAAGLCYLLFTIGALLAQMQRAQSYLESAAKRLSEQATNLTVRAQTQAAPVMATTTTGATGNGERSEILAHARAQRGRPVIDIEGIGPVFAKRLKDDGVVTIQDLRNADPQTVGTKLKTHATVVKQWQSMGELMEVFGVGPQFSELLVRAGVTSIDQLAGMRASGLMAKITETNEGRNVRIQGAPVNEDICGRWIHAANTLKGEGIRAR